MNRKTDSLIVLASFVVALGFVAVVAVDVAEAQTASATGTIIEHEEFTVPSNLDAGVTEFVPTSKKRMQHMSCEVDDDETGTLVIGDNTVSSTDYGEKLTAGEKFGGPHGGEYGRATGTDSVEVHCRFVVPKN
jgi:hypothetical protein